MIGPAEKSMRFGCRMQLERRLVELGGAIVIAFHLGLISVLQHFPRTREGLLAHGGILNAKSESRQRYESASCAKSAPCPGDGAEVEIWRRNRENSRVSF